MLNAGRTRRAEVLLQATVNLCERLNAPTRKAQGLLLLAKVAQNDHDLDRAEMLLWRSLTTFEQAGEPSMVADCHNNLAENARLRGNLDHAETGFRRSLELHEAMGSANGFLPRLNLGLTLVEKGAYAEARPVLELSLSEIEAAGRRGYLAWAHIALLPVAAHFRDWEGWEEHVEEARALVHHPDTLRSDDVWPLERAGLLALALGAVAQAREALELAVEAWQRQGRPDRVAQVARALSDLESAERRMGGEP